MQEQLPRKREASDGQEPKYRERMDALERPTRAALVRPKAGDISTDFQLSPPVKFNLIAKYMTFMLRLSTIFSCRGCYKGQHNSL